MSPTSPVSDTRALRPAFDLLARRLKTAAAGRRIALMQNHGNLGDALIHYGTLRFLEDYGFSARTFDMGRRADKLACLALGAVQPLAGRWLFVYGGSGAWSDRTILGHDNVHRQLRVTRALFVMPSTFQRFGLPDGIPAFARDRAESLKVAPQAEFCHDMAFYLALLEPARVLPGRTPPDRRLGLFFRTDNEQAEPRLAALPGNDDVSADGLHSDDVHAFLRRIDRCAAIATDRLHVAIAGLILGKRVRLVENNYFKIRAVHEASIAGIFPGIELLTPEAALALLPDLIEEAGS
ncbi:MAG: polysaccharide pyruvyl transferase family protein [Alphaproteobacteria bacterium]|nr:polysaccharide pyruvyl transferase family protein [Alphaproteobacteria bacterium]